MILYDCATAPSPRRVRMFAAEKQMKITIQAVDLQHNEQFGDDFRAVNPDETVPVLVLEDGTRLADIVGICRYIEESSPEPPLFGTSPVEKALIDGWLRWCDREGFYAVMDAFRNATPGLRGRALPGPFAYEQIPALAERSRDRITHFFDRLDQQLGKAHYVAGNRFSIADITAFVTVEFAGWLKIAPDERHRHLQHWLNAVRLRPSAAV